MFFIHNGVDAIEYSDDKEGCCKRKKAVKKFTFRKDVAIICGSFLFVIFAPSIGVNLYDIGNKYIKPYTVSINYEVEDRTLTVTLKYAEGKERVITGLKRISKPGLRVYANVEELPRVLNGLGIAIVSTPKGVMTDKLARKNNVGGEVIAYIW